MLTMECEHQEPGDEADPWQFKADFSFGAPPDWQVSTLTKAMNMLASDQLLYGSDVWWPTSPETYYEQYRLPHLAGFEVAATLSRKLPDQGSEERSRLRNAVFAENVLTHWEKATRGVPQRPRRAATVPQAQDTRHG